MQNHIRVNPFKILQAIEKDKPYKTEYDTLCYKLYKEKSYTKGFLFWKKKCSYYECFVSHNYFCDIEVFFNCAILEKLITKRDKKILELCISVHELRNLVGDMLKISNDDMFITEETARLINQCNAIHEWLQENDSCVTNVKVETDN